MGMEKPKENKNPLCDKPAEEKPQDDLQKKIEELQKKNEEYLNGWKRERADFLNYKKEEMERISALLKYANEELLLKILPVLDNIYLAEKQIPEDLKNHKWVEGILQLKNQISEFLKQEGVEEIKAKGDPPSHKASEGQRKFDPNFMEAVEEIESEGVEPGTIIEEVQKGYKLYGKVIRPARVKIIK